MAIPVIMPRQGQSVESCIITKWLKNAGDEVKTGDVLFSYETDKAAFEEEAKADGTLLAVFFEEGDDVPCLTNVAVIGAAGETFDEFAPDAGPDALAVSVPEEAAFMEGEKETGNFDAAAYSVRTPQSLTGVSPRAKAAAKRLGVDPNNATPTGPHGRVIERDIAALAKQSRTGTGISGRMTNADLAAQVKTAADDVPEAADGSGYTDAAISNLRKVIAKSMQESLSTIAQLTHNTSFDATNILAFREQLKAAPESMELPRITINDIILFTVSRILTGHDYMNAHYLGDRIRVFHDVHIGMAVDTPRGLLVPTLFDADKKSLTEISAESKSLVKSAQEGSINPDLLTGATFTVSNLGVYGIESFTPIINPPQVGLLGVNCITERVRTVGGAIKAYPAMGLSLTYDHCAVDGAPASRFLKDLVMALENFSALLIG